MGEGFKVYVEKLGQMANDMNDASSSFSAVRNIIDGEARVAQNALGFLGEQCNFPQKYKEACDLLVNAAAKSTTSLGKASDALLDIARDYVEHDDEYASKFKIPHDGKAPPMPKIRGGAESAPSAGGGPLQRAEPDGSKPQTPTKPNAPLPVQI